jgi:hypothetical protein
VWEGRSTGGSRGEAPLPFHEKENMTKKEKKMSTTISYIHVKKKRSIVAD